ncbi:hypothetical protein CON64_09535 [Bacillus pseudomycoides]|nr:hypothetical protein CON64_09535 [Bacillus pseudomycoides]
MLSKKLLTGSIISSMLICFASPSLAAVNENQNPTQTPIQNVQEEQSIELKASNADAMLDIAKKAEKFIVKNQDGTLGFTGNAGELGTTPENLNQYLQGIEILNIAIKEGKVKVNMNPTTNALSLQSTGIYTTQSNLKTMGYDNDFYGHTFYLSNAESKDYVYECNKWAAYSTGVAVIAGWIASFGIPQAAAVALASGLVAVGLMWTANEVSYRMTSKGTKIYLSNWNPVNTIQISGR